MDTFADGKQVRWHGKLLGYYIKGDRGLIFIAPRVRARHYFRLYEGYAMNEQLLQHLIDAHVIKIIIKENDTKRILTTTPLKWRKMGIPHRSKGVENQIVLKEKSFDLVV